MPKRRNMNVSKDLLQLVAKRVLTEHAILRVHSKVVDGNRYVINVESSVAGKVCVGTEVEPCPQST